MSTRDAYQESLEMARQLPDRHPFKPIVVAQMRGWLAGYDTAVEEIKKEMAAQK